MHCGKRKCVAFGLVDRSNSISVNARLKESIAISGVPLQTCLQCGRGAAQNAWSRGKTAFRICRNDAGKRPQHGGYPVSAAADRRRRDPCSAASGRQARTRRFRFSKNCRLADGRTRIRARFSFRTRCHRLRSDPLVFSRHRAFLAPSDRRIFSRGPTGASQPIPP